MRSRSTASKLLLLLLLLLLADPLVLGDDKGRAAPAVALGTGLELVVFTHAGDAAGRAVAAFWGRWCATNSCPWYAALSSNATACLQRSPTGQVQSDSHWRNSPSLSKYTVQLTS